MGLHESWPNTRGTMAAPQQRWAWALAHVCTVGPLSPQAYASALSVSIGTARRDLRELVRQGHLREGHNPRSPLYPHRVIPHVRASHAFDAHAAK